MSAAGYGQWSRQVIVETRDVIRRSRMLLSGTKGLVMGCPADPAKGKSDDVESRAARSHHIWRDFRAETPDV